MVKISDLITAGAQQIETTADNPRAEARLILAHILQTDVSALIVRSEDVVCEKDAKLFEKLVLERKCRKPIAYILGKKEFFGLTFSVNEHTLIPRPETEFVVEKIISSGKKTLLDLCTGSGCIPIAAAMNLNITALGVDISEGAVSVAEENAKIHNLLGKVSFEVADIMKKDFFGKFDVISSNPPYITDADMPNLSPDVKDYEPRLALTGGKDGLKFYRRIADIAPKNLNADGILIFEVGIGQAQEVAEIMEENFINIKIIKDLAGIDRVVSGAKKEK